MWKWLLVKVLNEPNYMLTGKRIGPITIALNVKIM